MPDSASTNGRDEEQVQWEKDNNEKCELTVSAFPFHLELEGNSSCNSLFICGARAGVGAVMFK
jgi:hypothetical protein